MFNQLNQERMKKLVNWFEIPANDFERAVNFYSKLLGEELKIYDCNGEKMGCFSGNDHLSGAISSAPGFKPSPDGVLISFYYENDLNLFLEQAELLGGKTIKPKTKIEAGNNGYFALFSDTEGNRLGVYSEK